MTEMLRSPAPETHPVGETPDTEIMGGEREATEQTIVRQTAEQQPATEVRTQNHNEHEVASRGIMSVITNVRTYRARKIVEKMERKDALYGHTAAIANGTLEGRLEEPPKPQTLVEKFRTNRMLRKKWSNDIALIRANRTKTIFGEDKTQREYRPSVRKAVTDKVLRMTVGSPSEKYGVYESIHENIKHVFFKAPEVNKRQQLGDSELINEPKSRTTARREKHGVKSARKIESEKRIHELTAYGRIWERLVNTKNYLLTNDMETGEFADKSQLIKATPVHFSNAEHRRTRRNKRRTAETLQYATDQAISKSWRNGRRNRAQKRIDRVESGARHKRGSNNDDHGPTPRRAAHPKTRNHRRPQHA